MKQPRTGRNRPGIGSGKDQESDPGPAAEKGLAPSGIHPAPAGSTSAAGTSRSSASTAEPRRASKKSGGISGRDKEEPRGGCSRSGEVSRKLKGNSEYFSSEALANYGDSLTQVKPGEYINLILYTDILGLKFRPDEDAPRRNFSAEILDHRLQGGTDKSREFQAEGASIYRVNDSEIRDSRLRSRNSKLAD